MRRADYRDLDQKYPEVKRWIDAVTTKPATRRLYFWGMNDFIVFSGLTPADMIRIKKQGLKHGEVRTGLEDRLVEWMRNKEKNYSQSVIEAGVAAVQSFLAYNGLALPKKFAQIGGREPLVLRDPEQAEVEALIGYAHDLEKKTLLTIAAECPCRPRVFVALKWGWLEPGWESKDVAQIILPKEFRPSKSGARKFEPIAFIGKRSIELLKRLKDQRGVVKMEDRIFPRTTAWFVITLERIFRRCIQEKAIRPSRADEQTLTLKSFRKYVFNAIDACRDISPEWRSMLKGRDLGVEKYYSKENVESLREVYRTRVYPQIWKHEAISEDELRKRQILDLIRLTRPEKYEEAVKWFASMYEIDEDTIDEARERYLAPEEERKRNSRRTERNGGKPFESKIVTEDELVQYVEEGWEICRELSNGRIVIRRALGD